MKTRQILLFAALPFWGATGAMAQQVLSPGPFIVFFDYERSNVTPEGQNILDAVIDNCAAGTSPTRRVIISVGGGADRSETNAMAFARAREGVRALRAATFRARCFANFELVPDPLPPRVETAPGVRELQNRRIEVLLRPAN